MRGMKKATAALLIAASTVFSTAAEAAKLSGTVEVVAPRTYTLAPRVEDTEQRQAKLEASMLKIMELLHKGKLPEIKELKIDQKVENGVTTFMEATADFGNDFKLTITSNTRGRNQADMSVGLSTGARGDEKFKSLWSFSNAFGGTWNGAPNSESVTGAWSALATQVGTRATAAFADLSQLLSGMAVPRGAAPKADAFRP
ncbi:MAG: hypothetical protein KGQ41_08770 [Alphaproteobacteria bacterium]|nr:hypothetical protein [Alphaproteobacteria bacterium]